MLSASTSVFLPQQIPVLDNHIHTKTFGLEPSQAILEKVNKTDDPLLINAMQNCLYHFRLNKNYCMVNIPDPEPESPQNSGAL